MRPTLHADIACQTHLHELNPEKLDVNATSRLVAFT